MWLLERRIHNLFTASSPDSKRQWHVVAISMAKQQHVTSVLLVSFAPLYKWKNITKYFVHIK